MAKQHLIKIFPVPEIESSDLKKFSIEIQMIKPYEIVDFWPKKPRIDNVLEAFIEKLYTVDSSDYFKIKVSEVQDENSVHGYDLYETRNTKSRKCTSKKRQKRQLTFEK